MAAEITDIKLDGTLYDIKDDEAVRSVTVGTTTTGGPDSAAKVENSGTDIDIVLDFTVPQGPKGDTGETGKSATIAVGQVTTGRPGTDVMIVNAGDENHGIFDFTIPQGEKGEKGDTGEQGIQGETGVAATIEIGTVTTGAAGTTARVSNVGTETAAIFNFTIPQGEKGDKGDTGDTGLGIESVEQTESSTESSGKNTMTVTLTDGTTSTFDVYNGARGATGDPGPQGEKGEKGDPGDSGSTGATGESATIEIGETTTGDAGTEAQVVNSGTSTNAILNFTIPKGDQGEQGIQGEMGPQGDVGPQGQAAQINAGQVFLYDVEDYDEDEGYIAYVINSGTTTNATFDFYLPSTQMIWESIISDEEDDSVPFAFYSDDDNSLNFYYDVVPEIGGTYDSKIVTEVYDINYDTTNVPWNDIASTIEKVIINESFYDTMPTSLAYWFDGMINVTFEGLENINTAKITSLEGTFRNCYNVTENDINNVYWDTSHVTTLAYMFYNCTNLTNINVSDWDTSNVIDMSYMFAEDSNLTTIYSNDLMFITDAVTNSSNMFLNCYSLVGGNGTTYDENQIDAFMAHIDTEDNPGYFSAEPT